LMMSMWPRLQQINACKGISRKYEKFLNPSFDAYEYIQIKAESLHFDAPFITYL